MNEDDVVDESVRVLVVDDHDLFGQSLTFALRSQGYDVQRVTDLRPDRIVGTAEGYQPQVVLLDLDLGESGGSGTALVPRLRRLGASVVMVTASTDRVELAEAVEAGALDLVSKADPLDRLVEAVGEAVEIRTSMSKHERDELLAELREHRQREAAIGRVFDELTRSEREVLAGLMEGKTADAIADERFVTVATVRSQIHSTLRKLGVRSQLGAVTLARRAGWFDEA